MFFWKNIVSQGETLFYLGETLFYQIYPFGLPVHTHTHTHTHTLLLRSFLIVLPTYIHVYLCNYSAIVLYILKIGR